MRELKALSLVSWLSLAFASFEVAARSPWYRPGEPPLPMSEGVPYGLLCGVGLGLAARILGRVVAVQATRDARPD
jgi:hypothetical protein